MSSKGPRTAYKHLLIELRKLKRVHGATLFGYQLASEHLRYQLGNNEINGKTKIAIQIAGNEYIIESSPYAMLERLPDTYPNILRESLFVRAISQFETFLVDTVWEISERTKEPFKTNKKRSYPQGQLLSFRSIDELFEKIIRRECRQLTSRGFSYAARYYDSQFGIRFSDGVNVQKFQEMHERRHIFVHRLGIVDERYQKNFSPELEVGNQLSVTEAYLHETIDSLIKLAEFIKSLVDKNWPQPSESQVEINDELVEAWKNSDIYQHIVVNPRTKTYLVYWFKAKFRSNRELEAHLSPDFTFKAEGKVNHLSSILIGVKRLSTLDVEWIVAGKKKVTGPYVGYQKMLAKRDRFVNFEAQNMK